MNENVKIRLELDPSCIEPEVIIRTDQKNDLIEKIVHAIEQCAENDIPAIPAYHGDTMVLLIPRVISRVYTENRKVLIRTEDAVYEARKSLRDVESLLTAAYFVRISRFEIVNLRKISGFDFSSAGTIRVIFQDGSDTYVARRYIQTIQQTLKSSLAGKEE